MQQNSIGLLAAYREHRQAGIEHCLAKETILAASYY
jgi:hypothetical protein